MENFRLKTLEEECRHIIDECGALLKFQVTGKHYLLSSGLHSDTFYQLSRVFMYGPARERLASLFIMQMEREKIMPQDIDILLGPAMGALPLIYTLQHFFGFEHTRAIFVERGADRKFMLGRGFSISPEANIFIVDDVLTTLGTIRDTIKVVNKACAAFGWDAVFIGFAAMIDRSSTTQDLSIITPTLKHVSVIRDPLIAYQAADCPYCKDNVPLIKP